MKKILFLIVFSIYCLLFSIRIYAISPTPSPKITIEPTTSDAINELKERIASRVAQLKLVERKGVIGTAVDISDTQITLQDLQTNTRFIDVDELTKFSSPSAKGSFGISDISKGTKLGILGLYNKQSRRILARFVDVVINPYYLSGVITGIEAQSYTLNVLGENSEQKTIDIETVTKTFSYSQSSNLVKTGFSKIKEGERIIVIGFLDKKDKNRIVASRVILFPDIPKNPKIVVPEKAFSPQETTTPSTGSGKKLTPITR